MTWTRKIFDCISFTIGAFAVAFGVVVAMGFIGMAIDTIGAEQDRIRVCQKHAATPYEFHRCR